MPIRPPVRVRLGHRSATTSRSPLSAIGLAVMLAGTAQPAAATTVTAYDGMSESARGALVEGAVAGVAQQHAGDAKIAACIQAYGAPAPGGAGPRLEADLQSLLARSRAAAPDEYEVERLVEAVIMVECGILPEE